MLKNEQYVTFDYNFFILKFHKSGKCTNYAGLRQTMDHSRPFRALLHFKRIPGYNQCKADIPKVLR